MLQGLKPFDRFYRVGIKHKKQWSLAFEVPAVLRPAAMMLAMLGRKGAEQEVVSGKSHYECAPSEGQPLGIPNVRIDGEFQGIELNVKNMVAIWRRRGEEAVLQEALASVGWMFQPVEDQPMINLHTWYGAYAPHQPEVTARIQELLRGLSNDGFRLLRQWLFAAHVRSEDVETPLIGIRNNAVVEDEAAWIDAHLRKADLKPTSTDR